jgi:hypothetical protein
VLQGSAVLHASANSGGNELLYLRVGLVVGIATLAVAVVPCVHHLRGFMEDRMRYWAWIQYLTICHVNADAANFFIIII